MTRNSVWQLDAGNYQRHALHSESRAWIEKNCYIDVWLEVLHAARLEPTAVLAFTVASDFDDDQWTFYKPPHVDISELYGVGVQELNVWKPLMVTVTVYLPSCRALNANTPDAVVEPSYFNPLSSWMITTLAAPIAAPLSSVTVPVMFDVPCADNVSANTRQRIKA